ncbi:hypothetical protein K1T71_013771 [Dendrolimus kikuchii]|uniref:Uncharacterized protein n=1 Tax=Dendrolimus kikuchii TaxID=765133 RepID=A0ACC1CFN2_9NEOP|nr:hypothetical protein K1T71_013771 [Dendrolimus kikuchii]
MVASSWLLLLPLVCLADARFEGDARAQRVRGAAGKSGGTRGRWRLAGVSLAPSRRLADVSPAPTWRDFLTAADGDVSLGLMTLPFYVLPVSEDKRIKQERPVSYDEINTNQLDVGDEQQSNTSPGDWGMSLLDKQLESDMQCPAYQKPPQLQHLELVESSQELVKLFREQKPTAPELPPAVIQDYGDAQKVAAFEAIEKLFSSANNTYTYQGLSLEALRTQTQAPSTRRGRQALLPPSRPRFARSLAMRGRLTVPRADYTETYTVMWDAATGAARVDLHNGGTSTYRLVSANGLMQGIALTTDRTGDSEVITCVVTTPRFAQRSERAPPGLPDMQLFSFAGYVGTGVSRVERWTHTVVGAPGDRGGAQGEALTFNHELIVTRPLENDFVIPLSYNVSVDSSVLGANCDGYWHVYSDYLEADIDPSILAIDIEGACDATTTTEQTETVAVRKNLIMQSSRFVASCNRLGATFKTALNLFGDRLKVELEPLFGVVFSEIQQLLGVETVADGIVRRGRAAADEKDLGENFDWSDNGAVTHVRDQTCECKSCWAHAVVAAVEGALYKKTKKLVALSEQNVMDCTKSTTDGKPRGCLGTPPELAYNYAIEKGLRGLNHYVPYKAALLPCFEENSYPVTHIQEQVNVPPNDIPALKKAIKENCPVVVIIGSRCQAFIDYTEGIFEDERWHKTVPDLDHAVVATGYGEHRNGTYFTIKNSWGVKWGKEGFGRLQALKNICGVLSAPSYPLLDISNVNQTELHAV